MTSASELFNNRRYRFGRNPIELEAIDSSSSLDRFSHHNRRHNNHNSRRHRHDLDGCDPLRRSANQINRPSFLGRESVRLDQGSSSSGGQSVPGNVNVENFTRTLGSERFSRSDRLPGAVLLARERLLERLRGVSSLGHRRSNRVLSGIPEDDFTLHDNIRDSEDWHSPAGVNPSTSSYNLVDPYLALQETKNRPPGLTQDALDRLHIEVFTNAEKGIDGAISRASQECSICLESFLEGAELVCLPCGHRFHSCCLNPWVRTCGDCPYCRAGIIVTNYRAIK